MWQRRGFPLLFLCFDHLPPHQGVQTDHLRRSPDPRCGAVFSGRWAHSDHLPLSRTKIEPSALPLTWAFCRSPNRWNRGWTGGKTRRKGWTNLPSLSAFSLALLPILAGEKCYPSHRRTKASTPRFTAPEVHGCYSARRVGTNRPKEADTGVLILGLRLGMTIGRESLPQNQRPSSSF